MKLRDIAFLIGASALAGCASAPQILTTPAGSVTVAPAIAQAAAPTPMQSLSQFTVADLQAASADAKAQTPPDITSAQCFDFLAALLPTIQTGGQPATFGAFLAFQKARDLANGVTSSNGTLKSLNLACAPLVISVQDTVNKLLLVGAGVAATGGALAPALPGLSAIGASLPIPLP